MSSDLCHVLLIEDKLDNIKLLQNLLSDGQHSSLANGLVFSVTYAETLEQGIILLEKERCDAVLLNLMLPDSQGFNTLIKLREKFPNIPIIVETETLDETLVVKSFQLGADGYLQIKILDSNLLIYEIRLGIERQQYRSQLALQQQQKQQAQEFADLEILANSRPNTRVTGRLFGAYLLQESLPDVFEELTQNYGELLELALEQRIFKVEHNISEKLRILADKLGFLKASPRDTIEMHTKVLKDKSQDVPAAKAQAYVSEGRLMILELMGYLVSFYRKYYIGLSNMNIPSSSDYLEK